MTLRSIFLYAVFAMMICLMAACGKQNYHMPVFAKADLPTLTDSSTWRYRVYDSATRHVDTMTVKVKQYSTTADGYFINFQVIDTGAVIDSGSMSVHDTYFEFLTAGGRLGNYSLRLPFATGDSWSVASDSSEFSVLPYQLNVDIQHQNYYVWDITRIQSLNGFTARQHLQFTRFIGLVRQEYSSRTTNNVRRRFSTELIDYRF